jgi:hypothetical protein
MKWTKWMLVAALGAFALTPNLALAQGSGHGKGHEKHGHGDDDDRDEATTEITTVKSCAIGMAATRAICLPDCPREIACLQD